MNHCNDYFYLLVNTIGSHLEIRNSNNKEVLASSESFNQYIFISKGNHLCKLLTILSCCSWGCQGKNTEVVCHSLLQWTTVCQTSPPWPTNLGWPHTAWLSFIELDKLWSTWSDWLLFCDCGFHLFALWCPLSACRLTWVSLILDVGYVFMAAPAKRSHCSLP